MNNLNPFSDYVTPLDFPPPSENVNYSFLHPRESEKKEEDEALTNRSPERLGHRNWHKMPTKSPVKGHPIFNKANSELAWSLVKSGKFHPSPLLTSLPSQEIEHWYAQEMENENNRIIAFLYHEFTSGNLLSHNEGRTTFLLKNVMHITTGTIIQILFMTPMNTIQESLGNKLPNMPDLLLCCVHDVRKARWAITHVPVDYLRKLEKFILEYMGSFSRLEIWQALEQSALEFGLENAETTKDQLAKSDYLRLLAWRAYFKDQNEVEIVHQPSGRHDMTMRELEVLVEAAQKTSELNKMVLKNFYLDSQGLKKLKEARKEIDVEGCFIEEDVPRIVRSDTASSTPVESLPSLSTRGHSRMSSALPAFLHPIPIETPRTASPIVEMSPQQMIPPVQLPVVEVVEKPKETIIPWYSKPKVQLGIVSALVSVTALATYFLTKRSQTK